MLKGWTMLGQLGNRVLVVDDDPFIRKLISGRLVAAGYVVRTAVDGLDAACKAPGGTPRHDCFRPQHAPHVGG